MKRPKIKIKRYNFSFSEETDFLIRTIAQETDLTLTMVVKRAVEDFAKKKGIFYGK